MKALRLVEERRNAICLAALMALLALGIAVSPALGGAASPGQLYAFGRNYYGQLGNETNLDGEPNPTPAPVNLPGEVGPVTQAAAGAGFSLVVTATGQLYAFGRNYYGQLGNETNVGNIFAVNPTPTPVTLPGASGPVTQVAAGMGHSLVVTASGQLYAFGYNWFGQLGNATNNLTEESNPTPSLVTLPGASGPVTQVAAGGFHSLALTSTGQLYAFGDNDAGQLGSATSSTGANPTPTQVTLPGATGSVTEIAAGEFFSLAVTSTGQLYAFGENHYGQLGNTINNLTSEPNATPTLVTLPGASGPVTQIAAGMSHSLARTSTGQLYTFGENRFGELGNTINNRTEQPNPTPTLAVSAAVTRIAAGDGYSLALTSSGQLYAFGRDVSGELGSPPGNERDAPHPTPMPVQLPGRASIETMAIGPWSDHTLVVSQLGVANSSLPVAEVDVPYSASVQGIGGGTPYTWAASGLPQGLSINRTSGAISGVPTATGSYTPKITLTDSYGVEASMPLTITITTPPPVSSEELPLVPRETALPSPLPTTPPTPSVQNARQSATRWREGSQLARISRGKTPTGTTFSFSLNEQASVTFSFVQTHGTCRRGHSCVAAIHKNIRHKKSCSAVTAATLSFAGRSGANNVLFAGQISRTSELKPGRYKLIIVATDSVGQRSTPVSLSFTIAQTP